MRLSLKHSTKKLKTKNQRYKSTTKPKRKKSKTYNHFHNILKLFDLPNFIFTTSETMRD